MKLMMVGIVCLAMTAPALAQYEGQPSTSKVQREAAEAKAAQRDRAAAAKVSGDDEHQLRQFEENWAQAIMRNDPGPVEQMAAAEFKWTGPNGEIKDRKQYVDDIGRRGNHVGKVQTDSMEVQVFGDMAVVSGEEEMDGHTAFGQDFSGKYRFTHVYVKRDGQWKVVSAQLTHVG